MVAEGSGVIAVAVANGTPRCTGGRIGSHPLTASVSLSTLLTWLPPGSLNGADPTCRPKSQRLALRKADYRTTTLAKRMADKPDSGIADEAQADNGRVRSIGSQFRSRSTLRNDAGSIEDQQDCKSERIQQQNGIAVVDKMDGWPQKTRRTEEASKRVE